MSKSVGNLQLKPRLQGPCSVIPARPTQAVLPRGPWGKCRSPATGYSFSGLTRSLVFTCFRVLPGKYKYPVAAIGVKFWTAIMRLSRSGRACQH